MPSPTLHLVIGPVAAGKTTFARQRVARTPALLLDLDAWMVRLYGGDPRPDQGVLAWYLERRERVRQLMWDVAGDALDAGAEVYLELGLLAAAERESWYRRARSEDRRLQVHHLDAPRDVRRARVRKRNEAPGPHTQIVPPAFFERASDAWEPPGPAEREAWSIVDA